MITMSQLRRIIRQERGWLAEGMYNRQSTGSSLLDFAEAYSGLGSTVSDQVSEVIIAFTEGISDPNDENFIDVVREQNPNALEMAHVRLRGILMRGDLGDEGDMMLEALDAALSVTSGG